MKSYEFECGNQRNIHIKEEVTKSLKIQSSRKDLICALDYLLYCAKSFTCTHQAVCTGPCKWGPVDTEHGS